MPDLTRYADSWWQAEGLDIVAPEGLPVRFNVLARQLCGASKRMVDQHLKELEAHRLVRREVLSTRPIAVAYEITDFGRSALGVLEQLKDWTEEHSI